MAAYLDDETALPYRRLRRELAAQTGRALVHPVFFGSAITGAGVEALAAGITELLPAAAGDPGGPVSGTVFKVERGPAGEKVAYVRLFSGTVGVRDRLAFAGRHGGHEGKVTAIGVFEHGGGRAAAVDRGRADRQALGAGRGPDRRHDRASPPARAAEGQFAPPTLETVVVPGRPADRGALHVALAQLAEQDPLINLRQDDLRQEVSVSLYGEVQKEVIGATLAGDFGLEVGFRESTTICIERPVGTGAAVERIATDPNPFLATVGLRVDPAPAGAGVTFRLEVELGSMPYAFFVAVEDTVTETLGQGLHGWQVTDCVVTMTHSGYWPRQSHAHATFDKSMSSTARDFRQLTPLVLMDALTPGRHQGLRADAPLPARAPGRHLRGGPARPGRAGGRARATAAPGLVVPARGGDPGRPGAPADPAAARPDPRRGGAGGGLRPLPAGPRPRPVPAADRPQPAGPQGVPAARPAARARLGAGR